MVSTFPRPRSSYTDWFNITLIPDMRRFSILLFATLCFSHISHAHPLPNAENHSGVAGHQLKAPIERRQYKAITWLENKKTIAAGVGASVMLLAAAGLGGLTGSEHLACKAVEKQQRIMQARWDELHPDGFTPAGDQMRPTSFDCKTQERHLKPLISYTNSADLYR